MAPQRPTKNKIEAKLTTLKRAYSPKTLKILFGLSGNECAYPGCKNPVIVPATEESEAIVLTQICHIYALSEDGPRGKKGLTEKELNAADNLVLFCPTHHVIVDGQSEAFPADKLKEWKRTHEIDVQRKNVSTDVDSLNVQVFANSRFPIAIVDQRVNEEVNVLRKSRFFREFDLLSSTTLLINKLLEGELSGATNGVKACALAWCARFLARKDIERAASVLNMTKRLGHCEEIEIADAFISSEKGDKNKALKSLARLNSALSRSAAFFVVVFHDGPERAVEWLTAAGVKFVELDPEGKFYFLSQKLLLGRWEEALRTLDMLKDQDMLEVPVLYHIVGITHLLSAVPTDFRSVILQQLPFDAASFPLASDMAALAARRSAHENFQKGVEVAQELGCPCAAAIADEYALWLELKDPDHHIKGFKRLETKLSDLKSGLRFVPLGLQFGVKLDSGAVEQEIEGQIALHGGITKDAAIARFALAFTQKNPEQVASYIARHCEELSKYLDKKSMRFLQIEMLSKAGLPGRALECLESLLVDGLSQTEESRLRRVIAEAEGIDPVEARMLQFKQSEALSDLIPLVDELEAKQQWDTLCDYARILYQRTHSINDAKRFAFSLDNASRKDELLEFLQVNPSLMAQSKNLQLLYCWSLYDKGSLVQARSELAKLDNHWDNPNYRNLLINLNVTLGEWNTLLTFIANEYQISEKRDPKQLIDAAKLAFDLGSPYAKDLLFAAATKGNESASILAAAYFLASSAGLEGEPEVMQWLEKAAALSGDDGPIQRMSLKDLLNHKPEWDRRESETWRLLSRGEIPMFLAANALNKSLIDLMLFPALANLSQPDPRRRGSIPAYSGKRPPLTLPSFGKVGVDATALITMALLNLLDKMLDAFEAVYLPHSTLKWLFEEKQKVTFHQPSRLKAAHQIRDFLARDLLEKFNAGTVADSDLSALVGDELAMLIAEAEQASEQEGFQRLVVRPSPVHRVASFMSEEADLTAHGNVITSCLSIVEKLRQRGHLTTDELKKATAYFHLHEKPWASQPDIKDGAILYLDDLATTYFQHLGLLERLRSAGFRPILSPDSISQANQLIAYESISGKASEVIERLRATLNLGINSGKIKVGNEIGFDGITGEMSGHPTAGVIYLAGTCDFIISDDRFLNQHLNVTDNLSTIPTHCTLDFIDALVSTGSLSVEAKYEHKTFLRRAGYLFVPLSDEELTYHLHASTNHDEKIIETAELKAIRESLLRIRMDEWIQLPIEACWLDTTWKVYVRALKELWKNGYDRPKVIALSNWLLEQIDIRGWGHCFVAENVNTIINNLLIVQIGLLMIPPSGAPQDIIDGYLNWVQEKVLEPLKEQFPDQYRRIVDFSREHIASTADMKLPKVKSDG